MVATNWTPKGARCTSRPAEAIESNQFAGKAESKYGSIAFGIKQNQHAIDRQDMVISHREIKVNAGPACPIRFAAPGNHGDSLADQCLTAAEIEWRRWSGWQMERTAEKQFRKKWA